MDLKDRILDLAISVRTKFNAITTALGGKQDTLVSGTNIKTINGSSILGSGNIIVSGGGGVEDPYKNIEIFLNNTSIVYKNTTGALNGAGSVGVPTLTDIPSLHRKYTITQGTASATAFAAIMGAIRHFFVKSSWTGGFKIAITSGVNNHSTTKRFFSGIDSNSTISSSDANPSTLVNMIGIGYDSGDSNLSLIRNFGSLTKLDLGAGFPIPATSISMFTLELDFTVDAQITYKVTDNVTKNTTSGVLTTNIPTFTNTYSFGYKIYGSVGGVSGAPSVNLYSLIAKQYY